MDLEEFYDEHVDKVYRFFYVKTLDKMVSEDLTSQTFIAFIEKSQDLAIQKRKQYLYGIMRNVWIEFLKLKYKQAVTSIEDIEDFGDFIEKETEDFEQATSYKNNLRKVVTHLPKSQKQIVILRYIDNMTIAQTADRLGRDRNYVKVTQKRAIATLRRILKEPYLETSNE